MYLTEKLLGTVLMRLLFIYDTNAFVKGTYIAKKHLHNIVILLLGILGSVLQKDRKDALVLSGQAVLHELTDLNSPLLCYLFLDKDGTETDDLEGGILASRLMNWRFEYKSS